LAIEHIRGLKPDERAELARFFRRGDVSLIRPVAAKLKEKSNGQL
jgi:hypothetical protein